jgi:hypothetical protein
MDNFTHLKFPVPTWRSMCPRLRPSAAAHYVLRPMLLVGLQMFFQQMTIGDSSSSKKVKILPRDARMPVFFAC